MDSINRYVVVMAGGVGSRFWPDSTEQLPKQFLDILNIGQSLISITYARFLNLVPKENIFVITNKAYKELCKEHLHGISDNNIILEPSRNNTGPCVAYAAYRLKSINENAVFITAPSDHVIEKENIFLEKVNQAFEHVEANDSIVTLGITPTRPDTGYGYIESLGLSDIRKVNAFKEKPNLEVAQEYLSTGNYLWNAGIFVWSAKGILDSFEKYTPKITQILGKDISVYNTDKEQSYIDALYPTTPDISVDYAILEKADNIYTIPSDIGWSDLGTWSSLYAYLDKDAGNNVIHCDASQSINVTNSIVKTTGKKNVVVKGLDNYIIIINDDSVLIYPKEEEQRVKSEVKKIGK